MSGYLVTPNSIPDGYYTLRVFLDSDDRFLESNETNNFFVISSNISVISTPDMVPDGTAALTVTGSNVVRDAGQSFTVNARIRNDGDNVSIPSYLVAFYLVDPSDTFLNPDEAHFLGYGSAPALTTALQNTPGYVTASATFNLPSDLALPEYRLGVRLDPFDDVTEYSDMGVGEYNWHTNNYFLSPSDESVGVRYVIERPDYSSDNGQSSMSPTTIPAGEYVTFSGRVRNTRTFTSPNITTIRHFIRFGFSGIPISLGTTFIPSIPANGTYEFTAVLQIPPNQPPGDYQYLFDIDDAGVVPEYDETNNRGYLFGTDLTVTAPQLPDIVANGLQFSPSSVAPGDELTVEVNLENTGYSSTGSFNGTFYLSQDTVLANNDDILLGTRTVSGGLSAGQSANFTPTLTIPSGTAYGEYRLGVILDSGSQVEELFETNNSLLLTSPLLTVSPDGNPLLPDLRPISTTFEPTRADFEELVSLTVDIKNQGTSAASGVICHAYLSLDNVAGNADDIPVGNVNLGGIGIAATESGKIDFKMPGKGAPVGMYRVVLVADETDSVAESNETNNTYLSGPLLQLLPADDDYFAKLVATGASASPALVIPGQTVDTIVTVVNKGGSSAAGVETALVLSLNDTIGDADDVLLESIGPDQIDLSETGKVDARAIKIPEGTSPGSYNIGWEVDPDNLIPQDSSSGNRISVPIIVRERRFHAAIVQRDSDHHIVELRETDPAYRYRVMSSWNLQDWKESDFQKGSFDVPLVFQIKVDENLAEQRYFHQGEEH
ncbi:CARDB domain-containing protein [Roseibacillus ishigakijimensis]|uniref:CARDB domain-containing protein n=1 Tax=Roseibacillus ishigakijimensis TaxID=454146 RepID=A0A934RNQ0_9BACT|nr:hypothetical protein [Roseibacillus ishigakijimensis]